MRRPRLRFYRGLKPAPSVKPSLTTEFLNTFVYSPKFDEFLTYSEGYNPSPEEFVTVHFLWETFLKESQFTFIEKPTQLYYVCDHKTQAIIGPHPLTLREFVYAVFVSSLLMFKAPTAELSLQFTKLVTSNPPPGIDLTPVFSDFEQTVKAFKEYFP